MNKLEIAKQIIRENYSDYDCGIFNTKNLVGDVMGEIYEKDGLTILGCYHWSYFEVFGLNSKEFQELENYYNDLRSEEEE